MNIDFSKIKEVYGESVVLSIRDSINDVVKNLNYLKELNFTDVEDIFERYCLIFLDSPETFQDKVNTLIEELGDSYVDIIENNLSILENLM